MDAQLSAELESLEQRLGRPPSVLVRDVCLLEVRELGGGERRGGRPPNQRTGQRRQSARCERKVVGVGGYMCGGGGIQAEEEMEAGQPAGGERERWWGMREAWGAGEMNEGEEWSEWEVRKSR